MKKEKQINNENIKKVEKMIANQLTIESNEQKYIVIDLDIGGTHKITTLRSTLTKVINQLINSKYADSTLAKLFSLISLEYVLKLHNGRYFIDRDGQTFIQLLDYLSNYHYITFRKRKNSQF